MTDIRTADGFPSLFSVGQTAGASAPALYSNRGAPFLTSNQNVAVKPAGVTPTPSAGSSFLIAIASLFAIAAAAFLSGPLPIDLVTDHQRIALGLVCGGISLAFAGLSVLFRTLDANLPPRGVAVLKARARFQRISRRQIRNKRHRFMYGEFRDLVRDLSASILPEMGEAKAA